MARECGSDWLGHDILTPEKADGGLQGCSPPLVGTKSVKCDLQADIFVNNLNFVGFLGEARIHLFLFSSSTEKPKTFVPVVE